MRLKVEPVFLDFSGASARFIKGLGGRKELAFVRRYQGPELFNLQLEGVVFVARLHDLVVRCDRLWSLARVCVDRVVVYRVLCPSSQP